MTTVGARGPLLLSDFAYVEDVQRFDRERIPERVVHAKGSVTGPHPHPPSFAFLGLVVAVLSVFSKRRTIFRISAKRKSFVEARKRVSSCVSPPWVRTD